MIYLIHCNNLCKCHTVFPPSTSIKGKNEGQEDKINLFWGKVPVGGDVHKERGN
jgi:hypothetical protein